MRDRSLGVFLYSDAFSGKDLEDTAQRVEGLGYETLWYVEALSWEIFACGTHLLASTSTLEVGAGIANIYARDPMATVQGGRSLHEFSGGRYILGLGVSHDSLVKEVRGHEYRKPLTYMRQYLDRMDLARPLLPGEDPPMVLAALGPKMVSLGGERTQGVLPFNCPPEHTAAARNALGTEPWLITGQHVCWCENPSQARAIARSALRFYTDQPNYFRNWFRYGFDESDIRGGLSDRLVDRLVAWGSLSQIQDRINEHLDAGATQVAINAISYDSDGQPRVPKLYGQEFNYACIPDWNLLEELAP